MSDTDVASSLWLERFMAPEQCKKEHPLSQVPKTPLDGDLFDGRFGSGAPECPSDTVGPSKLQEFDRCRAEPFAKPGLQPEGAAPQRPGISGVAQCTQTLREFPRKQLPP